MTHSEGELPPKYLFGYVPKVSPAPPQKTLPEVHRLQDAYAAAQSEIERLAEACEDLLDTLENPDGAFDEALTVRSAKIVLAAYRAAKGE